tara:strand:- start:1497 stop:1760 length:264 start_codon:yes stop_codon:yes gene_type:complete
LPKILDRLVGQLKSKGHSKKASYAIATSALQKSGNLKSGTGRATSKGRRRGNMTPGQRAKNRASKTSGKPQSSYKYNSKTNRATKIW